MNNEYPQKLTDQWFEDHNLDVDHIDIDGVHSLHLEEGVGGWTLLKEGVMLNPVKCIVYVHEFTQWYFMITDRKITEDIKSNN